MSKTIKVIDLFNKIVNGEEVPRKIKYYDEDYILNEGATSIENLYLIDSARVGWFNHANFSLDSTVEIIEEQEKIEIIRGWGLATDYKDFETINHTLNRFGNKINELVQAVKQLDKKIKEK